MKKLKEASGTASVRSKIGNSRVSASHHELLHCNVTPSPARSASATVSGTSPAARADRRVRRDKCVPKLLSTALGLLTCSGRGRARAHHAAYEMKVTRSPTARHGMQHFSPLHHVWEGGSKSWLSSILTHERMPN